MISKKTFIQGLKFIIAGIFNTAIDFIVLNILIGIFGTGVDNHLFPYFKSISFIVALLNSYFMNKFWVFNKKVLETNTVAGEKNSYVEGLKFALISTAGFLLNVAVASGVFHILVSHISVGYSANIGSVVGTIVVLFVNFFGYKFLVFKS